MNKKYTGLSFPVIIIIWPFIHLFHFHWLRRIMKTVIS